jgi:hypothetical protein
VYGTIPLLRHYNACYQIQLTLVSDTNIAASYNKRYNAAKAVFIDTSLFGIERNDSGIVTHIDDTIMLQ